MRHRCPQRQQQRQRGLLPCAAPSQGNFRPHRGKQGLEAGWRGKGGRCLPRVQPHEAA